MAPRGSKRAAPSASGPASKRGRGRAPADPVALRCEAVAKALRGSKALPGGCTAMFGAIIPGSLGVAAAERHESQAAVVEMIAGALAKVEAPMQQRIAEAEKEAERQGQGRGEAAAAAEAAAKACSDQAAVVEAHKAALESEEGAVKTQQAASDEASAEKEKLQEEQQADAADKELCEAAEREHLAALREATWEDAVLPAEAEDPNKLQMFQAAAKPHVDALLPLCVRLGVEDSMIQALPIVAARPRSERGPFDVLALTEVGKRLSEHAAAHATALEARAAALAALVAKADAAKGAVQAAEAARDACAEASRAAEEEQSRLRGQEKAAKQASRTAGSAASKAESALAAARKQLASFRDGPVAAFEELRNWDVEEAHAEAHAEAEAPEEATMAAA